MFTLEWQGADELEAALRALPDSLRKGLVERALMHAAEPIAAYARGRVSYRTGHTQSRIKVSTRLSRRQRRKSKEFAEAFVGASPSRAAHLIELGTKPRFHKSGKSTGQMPARPFLRPAFDAEKENALRILGEDLWLEIEKTARRLGQKSARLRRR